MHGSCCEMSEAVPAELSRRGFLGRVALGAGAVLFTSFIPRAVLAGGGTDTLLLSCMDYRLMDDVAKYMNGRGLAKNYDHVILAGASLGVLQDKNLSWGQAFWDHLDVAIKLHAIKKVIVLDHRDCGAYKVFLGPDHAKDVQTELAAHAQQLKALKAMIAQKQPNLSVETLLMSLDGKVETVA